MSALVIRSLGMSPMVDVWREMKSFTAERQPDTPDELWFVEHPPVFTLGTRASREHLLAPGDIEVLQIDRGGQVTYHGPGQLVCYVLLDMRRRGLDIRRLVVTLEEAVIASLAEYHVEAAGRRDAPGVYAGGRKFAALGLRISRGCSYHGLAVNVAMDLEPFRRIHPCGLEDIEVTQVSDLTPLRSVAQYRPRLEAALVDRLGGEATTLGAEAATS